LQLLCVKREGFPQAKFCAKINRKLTENALTGKIEATIGCGLGAGRPHPVVVDNA
jgi:hypothetical protein